jgi:hypothetical protein
LISQQVMPVHLNLSMFRGSPLKNGQELEVILGAFKFTPK